MLQFLNKLSLNYASAYGLIHDLGLEGQRYSWVAAIFNFGYVFWAIPANLIIQRVPIAKYTGTTILIWSVILCCHCAVTNYAGMLVIRFLLGMFEAGISPSVMTIVSMFYTRDEQPLRMCTFLSFNGMSTMVGALLGFGLGHVTSTAISSWQLIFLVIGLMNFVWAWVFLWFIPDTPANARFLSHKQKVVATWRVSKNMVGVKTKQFKLPQALEATLDAKVWCLTLIGAICGIVNGGVSNFATSLIKGFGFSGLMATLLQLPLGAFEFILVPVCGLAATYVKDIRCLLIILVCLPPFGGLLGIRFTDLEHRWTLVGCSWLQFIIGAPVILSWNILTTNIAGHTKRSIANGLWFTFYAAGNIGGSNIFFAREAPRYFSAVTALIVCYCAMIVIAAILWVYMAWDNRARNRAMAGQGQTLDESERRAILEGFQDRTDKESKGFRYGL
ncbi:MFS general substrate transporter [Polychaeton citri CBS 116435]|uniref:MFS general substrate transporter n=1 Tax=Polychaeton citri CBS 116435 TaxID=1314669 RepID=A0A9P4QI15_9PEZI|nr:MFS general substrate transporter [Polychaeton citri CBS 116435]